MCFSASASFGAGVILAGAGFIAIKKSESPKMLAFASVPFLFGFQQCSEGMLWLSFTQPKLASWHDVSMYLFLLISQVIWPVLAPFALWLIEPDKARKKMIFYFMLLGGALSAYMLYCLFVHEASAIVESKHIRFTIHFPYRILHRGAYFLATVVPIFLSSMKWMKLLAVTMLGSLVFSFIAYTHYVISVWCFFAAILSVQVIFIIVQNKGTIGSLSMNKS
ncbi:DUF6629 family protein [Haliscomenobacter sp.]|uniref:DUF6629 family protein n=1 Tax=Haliscomenobacter sp. TaxID=2717303 RepID=UPI003BAD52E8